MVAMAAAKLGQASFLMTGATQSRITPRVYKKCAAQNGPHQEPSKGQNNSASEHIMKHDNDNGEQPIAADRVLEARPRPDELNCILHRRFPGMGPAYGRQLDDAAKATFNADHSKWLGLDGRWHSTEENYRQPKGKRRQGKANAKLASHMDEAESCTEPVRDGWMFTEDVACRWREYAPGIAEDALEIVGKVVPATSGSRLMQFGAVEDAMIRTIDAKRALAANDNEPISHRRNRPRRRAA